MLVNDIKKILMERNRINDRNATNIVANLQRAVMNYLEDRSLMGADEICKELFNFEPDSLS